MTKSFHYSAIDANGKKVSGRSEATDQLEIIRTLRQQGLTPVHLGQKRSLADILFTDLTPKRLTLAAKSRLVWRLALFIEAGLTADQALAECVSEERDDEIRAILEHGRLAVQQGEGLDSVLGNPALGFAPADIAMIRAGIKSGAVLSVLKSLADAYSDRDKRQKAIKAAAIYPALLLITAAGVITLLLTVVIPSFEPIFASAGKELPPLTRGILAVSDILIQWGPSVFVLGSLAALITALWGRSPDNKAVLDGVFLKLPLLGSFIAESAEIRLNRGMALLLGGGVPVEHALDEMRRGETNGAIGRTLQSVCDAVRAGGALGDSLADHHLASPSAASILRVGQNTGTLAQAHHHVAELLAGRQADRLQRLSAILTPVITLSLGLMVGLIVWSVMGTILDINTLV